MDDMNFLKRIAGIVNSGQSRALAVTGNIGDMFFFECQGYIPLLSLLKAKYGPVDGRIVLAYRLSGTIQFLKDGDKYLVRDAYDAMAGGGTRREKAIRKLAGVRDEADDEQPMSSFDGIVRESVASPTTAMEFLRQLCLASRTVGDGGRPLLEKNLVIIIEGADMLIPQGEISRLSEADRKRIAIFRDWFSDPGFLNGNDSVILMTESRSRLNEQIARMPQLLEVEIPSPDVQQRLQFVNWFMEKQPEGSKPKIWSNAGELADHTAGLSIHALMQLLKGSAYRGEAIQPADVVAKVEEFLKSQLGEDVVEFKRPSHTLGDVMGNMRLKKFLNEAFIPRLKRTGKGSISGATVCGATRSGKTFIFEAVAFMTGRAVIVLKGVRSKWYGDTDAIFERLRRFLEALGNVLVFVDEADTTFGGFGPDVHETERRLTGKFQNMMSDTKLRGKVVWLLMTARIHLLPLDIRSPGRAGDYIIPIFDPRDGDLKDFLTWMLAPVCDKPGELAAGLMDRMKGYTAGAISSLRDELIGSVPEGCGKLPEEQILKIIGDRIPQNTGVTRRIQELHALLNCTHLQLMPEGITQENLEEHRDGWTKELAFLERAAL